jgi:Protein of unknown function (DUF1549)/Protein of unknown function (DUF1553)
MRILLPCLVVLGVLGVVVTAASNPVGTQRRPIPERLLADDGLANTGIKVDLAFRSRWREAGVAAAPKASELIQLRRLSLAMMGTIPSLEEVREFERLPEGDRIEAWLPKMLTDSRFSTYFSARLARAFVGADDGQFILFRRDRFQNWLATELAKDTPYDQLVKQMIGEHGLWTGTPATNFVTAAYANDDLMENKLAGRTSRAFLGQRIDCAECHDHPFSHWKQVQFEGLQAFFGQTTINPLGVGESTKQQLTIQDRKTLEDRTLSPQVPFHEDWLPNDGTSRQRLAEWVTHSDNRRLDRAIVNRVWGLMFGRPLVEPVDDLPDPPATVDGNDPLDLLAEDFRTNGRSLHRLIRLITKLDVFALSSEHPALETDRDAAPLETVWAVFPLTRLRPEQMIGSMLQATSLQTIDHNSHLLTRMVKFFNENDFVREYGELGEDELTAQVGTIPQALLRMNGRFSQELGRVGPFTAAGRVQSLLHEPTDIVDATMLVCLTRRPSAEEREQLSGMFAAEGNDRVSATEDLFWMLFNSPEFAWNH